MQVVQIFDEHPMCLNFLLCCLRVPSEPSIRAVASDRKPSAWSPCCFCSVWCLQKAVLLDPALWRSATRALLVNESSSAVPFDRMVSVYVHRETQLLQLLRLANHHLADCVDCYDLCARAIACGMAAAVKTILLYAPHTRHRMPLSTNLLNLVRCAVWSELSAARTLQQHTTVLERYARVVAALHCHWGAAVDMTHDGDGTQTSLFEIAQSSDTDLCRLCGTDVTDFARALRWICAAGIGSRVSPVAIGIPAAAACC